MTQPILIFDLGGVFIELTGVDTMHEWTRDRLDINELWDIWFNSEYVKGFETGQMDKRTFARGIIGEYGLPVETEEFLRHFSTWSNQLFPGTRRLLDRLKDTYTLVSLSNTNAIHWENLCDQFNLDRFFHHNFPSHVMGKIKPDLSTFTYVMDQLDARPGEAFFFDDTVANVQNARRAGMNAFHVVGIDHLNRTLSDLSLI